MKVTHCKVYENTCQLARFLDHRKGLQAVDQKRWPSGWAGGCGLRHIPVLVLSSLRGTDPCKFHFLDLVASGFCLIWSMGSPDSRSNDGQRSWALLSASGFGCQYHPSPNSPRGGNARQPSQLAAAPQGQGGFLPSPSSGLSGLPVSTFGYPSTSAAAPLPSHHVRSPPRGGHLPAPTQIHLFAVTPPPPSPSPALSSPGQTTKRPHTTGRLEAVSLYKGNQHHGPISSLRWLMLVRLTALGAGPPSERNTTRAWGLSCTPAGSSRRADTDTRALEPRAPHTKEGNAEPGPAAGGHCRPPSPRCSSGRQGGRWEGPRAWTPEAWVCHYEELGDFM